MEMYLWTKEVHDLFINMMTGYSTRKLGGTIVYHKSTCPLCKSRSLLKAIFDICKSIIYPVLSLTLILYTPSG